MLMSTIPPTAILRRSPRVAYRELGGDRGAVLLRLDTGAYHGIDRVGVLTWDLLEKSPSFGDLLRKLGDKLDETPPTFESDMAEFVVGLRDRGLIEVIDTGVVRG
jgi:coenzyme PQQ synthesis protein D (PqqD)